MNDSFDLLRQRWVASLVGDEHLDIILPVVRERIEAQDREARAVAVDGQNAGRRPVARPENGHQLRRANRDVRATRRSL